MRNFFDHDTAKAVYYVYLYKNITKAGGKLGLTQSAMSRRIQMAEERTGLLIFERGFHEMTPTKQGARYIESCKEVLHIGDAALKDAHALVGGVEGTFTLCTMPSLASLFLPKIMSDFRDVFPNTVLNICEDKNPKDVFSVDAIIGYHQPDNEHLSQNLLFTQTQGIFASTGYLEKNPAPETLADLHKHTLLAVDDTLYDKNTTLNWHLNVGLPTTDKQRKAHISLSSNDGRYNAMCQGMGIGVCGIHRPKLFGHDNLIQVLPGYTSDKIGLYYSYNGRARNTTKARLIQDYLQKKIAALGDVFS